MQQPIELKRPEVVAFVIKSVLSGTSLYLLVPKLLLCVERIDRLIIPLSSVSVSYQSESRLYVSLILPKVLQFLTEYRAENTLSIVRNDKSCSL